VRLGYQRNVVGLALLAALPGTTLGLALLWTGSYSSEFRWVLTVALLAACSLLGVTLARTVARPLATLGNVVSALRQGDYSIRMRLAGGTEDQLAYVAHEVNALSSSLREQRLGAAEATALLGQVMEQIDVAIVSFDASARVRLVNRATEGLLAQPREQLLGRTAAEIGTAELLTGEVPRVFEGSFPGGTGRYELRRRSFRQEGVPQQLLVLPNLSSALRQEERQAWQRLIRVLGHELNNSLATIKSISQSLEELLARRPGPLDREADLQRGLGIIRSRAEALARFIDGYTRLARLPAPRPVATAVGPLLERVARLEARVAVRVINGPDVILRVDCDQLEQALINVLRNAAEATLETGGSVSVGWSCEGEWLRIDVDDEGPGPPPAHSLFVPFFTTKPQGSGIGLVLSRQIVEAHRGTLSLEAREGRRGCRARLRLPLGAP